MSVKATLISLYKSLLPLSWREKMRVQFDALERYIRIDLKVSKKYKYKDPDTNFLLSRLKSIEPVSFLVLILRKNSEPTAAATLRSVANQTYTNWKSIELDRGGIPAAVKGCIFEYVVILRNGDTLTKDALLLSALEISGDRPALIYSDNDYFVKEGKFILPNFKPDYSPESLLAKNSLTGLLILSRDALLSALIEPLAVYAEYDLALKVTDSSKVFVKHISSVLCHVKISREQALYPERINSGFSREEIKRVVFAALQRRNIEAELLESSYDDIFRIKRKIVNRPLVSILIPFKDKPDVLKVCLDSILKLSTYTNFEIIGINNNSLDVATFEMMQEYAALDSRIRFTDLNIPFNFSKLNNHAASISKGEQLILLNNDIEIISPDWIESLLEYSQLESIGVVGAKLYYPNGLVQHAGVFVGIGGVGGHAHKMAKRNAYGYFGRLQYAQNVSALTAACFMVKKKIYQEVNGLNEEKFEVAFNDVDFCLKVQYCGYQNIFTPYCEAYHYESISRGAENTPEKLHRFRTEIAAFKALHKDILAAGDPYYNRNLTQKFEDFSLK